MNRIVLILLSIVFLFNLSCNGTAENADLPEGDDGIMLVSGGKGIDDVRRLNFEESFTFNVLYNGEEIKDFDCSLLDSEDELILSGGGTVVCNNGEGRYTAPKSLPAGGSYIQLVVSVDVLEIVAKASGTVTATMDILLPCTYSLSCGLSDYPVCLYSQCVSYDYMGIDETKDACDQDDGPTVCGGSPCVSFDKRDCSAGYCVDDIEDVFITDEDDCEDGYWYEDAGVCITPDILYCSQNGGGDDDPVCGDSVCEDGESCEADCGQINNNCQFYATHQAVSYFTSDNGTTCYMGQFNNCISNPFLCNSVAWDCEFSMECVDGSYSNDGGITCFTDPSCTNEVEQEPEYVADFEIFGESISEPIVPMPGVENDPMFGWNKMVLSPDASRLFYAYTSNSIAFSVIYSVLDLDSHIWTSNSFAIGADSATKVQAVNYGDEVVMLWQQPVDGLIKIRNYNFETGLGETTTYEAFETGANNVYPTLKSGRDGGLTAVWETYDGVSWSFYQTIYDSITGWPADATLLRTDMSASRLAVAINGSGKTCTATNYTGRNTIYCGEDSLWYNTQFTEDIIKLSISSNNILFFAQRDNYGILDVSSGMTPIAVGTYDINNVDYMNYYLQYYEVLLDETDAENIKFHLIWTEENRGVGGSYTIYHRYYNASTHTWGDVSVLKESNTTLLPKAAIDGSGNIILVYSNNNIDDYGIYTKVYKASNSTWYNTDKLSDVPDTNFYVYTASSGKTIVLYNYSNAMKFAIADTLINEPE